MNGFESFHNFSLALQNASLPLILILPTAMEKPDNLQMFGWYYFSEATELKWIISLWDKTCIVFLALD